MISSCKQASRVERTRSQVEEALNKVAGTACVSKGPRAVRIAQSRRMVRADAPARLLPVRVRFSLFLLCRSDGDRWVDLVVVIEADSIHLLNHFACWQDDRLKSSGR
jgi:hypothetical protein